MLSEKLSVRGAHVPSMVHFRADRWARVIQHIEPYRVLLSSDQSTVVSGIYFLMRSICSVRCCAHVSVLAEHIDARTPCRKKSLTKEISIPLMVHESGAVLR